jgi:hypothetical protein
LCEPELLPAALHVLGLVCLFTAHSLSKRKAALCHYRVPPIGRAGDLIAAFLPPTRAVKLTVLKPFGEGVGAAGAGLEFTRCSFAASSFGVTHHATPVAVTAALRTDQGDPTSIAAIAAGLRRLEARFARRGVEMWSHSSIILMFSARAKFSCLFSGLRLALRTLVDGGVEHRLALFDTVPSHHLSHYPLTLAVKILAEWHPNSETTASCKTWGAAGLVVAAMG